MEKRCQIVKLDESSLGRVLQHVQGKKNVKNWGMMTAYRYANTPNQNKTLNKKLEGELRKMGHGFFKVEGHWVECQDGNLSYEDCPKNLLKDAIEESLFVPNISAKEIHKLGKKYGQDAVIFGGEQTKGNATLIFKDGKVENIGKFSPNKIQQAYSKLKGGKTFVFNPEEPKVSDDETKLIDLMPKAALDKKVKNPQTGNMVKVKTALSYDEKHPAFKAATSLVVMMNKKK
jgi:hypothetical protein